MSVAAPGRQSLDRFYSCTTPMSPSSYDLLPYEDYCFAATHPEHLYTVARLLGHEAPDFARCRVLELGCARAPSRLAVRFATAFHSP